MLASFLLTLRETLEAVLIIGIVLGALNATRRDDYRSNVWWGMAAGVFLSLAIAIVLNLMGASLEGMAEEVFEGLTMLMAAAVLTWMIFWMHRQSSQIRQSLEIDVQEAGRLNRGFPIFSLAFLAVFREGLELSLFLTAASFSAGWSEILMGALGGLGIAAILGMALTRGLLQLDLRRFFLMTSFLLILIAGGLVAHGVHELNEAGWIPTIIDHVWDLNPWFNETSTFGQFMTALFGYNANPSLSEILAVVIYFGTLVFYLLRQTRGSMKSWIPSEGN